MIIGLPKEIKKAEYRVALTPAGARELTQCGHDVLVEMGAGLGSGFPDEAYVQAGAWIITTPGEIFGRSELVLHVKEPQPCERNLIREGQVLVEYLHLAADQGLTEALIRSRCVAFGLETFRGTRDPLPLLTPMSEVAGCLAAQQAAKYLERPMGGRGILLGGVTGVEPATAVVIGGGVVGENAARKLAGLGARVHVLDTNLDRLRRLREIMPANCVMLKSDEATIRRLLPLADAVIGAVLVAGAKAPRLITRDMLSTMKPGSIIVDVAIDQGGCCETSRPTTHENPTYVVDGVVHYCVANMPGCVPWSSTMALTNATLPYILAIANLGWRQAARERPDIRAGINVLNGQIVCPEVAKAFGMPFASIDDLL
ncbi:MAG: alanine dehydrogenase [Patescibacteria group bacterium]|nr:alanine dehydrogenase [Patescibacteria group bacterium]